MDGWTADEERHMAWYRGESIYDPRLEDDVDERLSKREEPEEERLEPEVVLPPPRRSMTRRERVLARLGSRHGCLICEGQECWCGVAERLRDLTCGHAGSGVCRWCLAEFLMLGHRGSVRTATWRARTLVAAKRLRQWRQGRGAA